VELTGVAAVSSGTYHTCAASREGIVRCWGANWYGQLGIGLDVDDRLNPTQVEATGWRGSDPTAEALMGVVQISSGGEQTCALLNDRTVRCWGSNNVGQLGDGATSFRLNPAQVLVGEPPHGEGPLNTVISISSGGGHTCALLNGGTVRCWGRNASGVLGTGTEENSSYAVLVVDGGSPLGGVVEQADV
jgi:alpha-tubulin suppressor-like RCC1 family protein